MSIGNTKGQGNKGANFPYQLRTLQLLAAIAGNTGGICGVPGIPGILATEATLLQVLSVLQAGQEFEQMMVKDATDAGYPNSPVYTQVRVWNTDTHTFEAPVYYTAAGVLHAVTTPIYVDTSITRTPSLVRASGAGLVNIAAGTRSISFYNSGTTDLAEVNGVALKQGEMITFDAGGQSDVLGAMTYDPKTSELLIAKVI